MSRGGCADADRAAAGALELIGGCTDHASLRSVARGVAFRWAVACMFRRHALDRSRLPGGSIVGDISLSSREGSSGNDQKSHEGRPKKHTNVRRPPSGADAWKSAGLVLTPSWRGSSADTADVEATGSPVRCDELFDFQGGLG